MILNFPQGDCVGLKNEPVITCSNYHSQTPSIPAQGGSLGFLEFEISKAGPVVVDIDYVTIRVEKTTHLSVDGSRTTATVNIYLHDENADGAFAQPLSYEVGNLEVAENERKSGN